MAGWMKFLMIAVLPIIVGVIVLLIGQPALCRVDPTFATAMSAARLQATPAPLIDAPKSAPQCSIASAVPGDVYVRSYPGAQFAELGILNGDMTALGVTDDGWVTVGYGERRGWLRAENLRFNGACESLPDVRNPLIPTAPLDDQAFAVQIDRDGEGTFSNTISTPEGDSSDVLWVVIINLYSAPPNNLREFTLTMQCDGAQADSLRWGWAYRAPTLRCGDSLTIPFTINASQQPFHITVAPDSPQSYIPYRLAITGGAAG